MNNGIKILLLLYYAVSGMRLSAQTLNPQLNFKQLHVQNGLAQNIVYHFLQDNQGYIWIGTRNGLTRYDGITTLNFYHNEQSKSSLASNFITRILEDSAHTLWIGNEKGIDRLNRHDNTFLHYGVTRPGHANDDTYCVPIAFVSPTELWFIDTKTKSIRAFDTKNGLSRFVAGIEEVEGTIYVSKQTGVVHFWSYQSIGTVHLVFKDHVLIKKTVFFSGKNSRPILSQLLVVHVLQQNDTTAWLSTNEGLICMNPVSGTYKMYNKWDRKPVRGLRYAALSADNILWVGSGSSGMYTFDIHSRTFTGNSKNIMSDPFSICGNNIVSVYFDKSGNVWAGSYGNGASYAGVQNILFTKHVSEASGTAGDILWAGLDNKENCWCIVEDGVAFWMLNGNSGSHKYIAPLKENGKRFSGSVYKLLLDRDKETWCATNEGLFLYNRSTNRMHRIRYPILTGSLFGSNWIRDIIRLGDGKVIFSTFAGLYIIKKEKDSFAVSPYSDLNKMPDKSFGTLFEDEAGNICVKGNDSLFILRQVTGSNEPARVHSFAFPRDINYYFDDTVAHVIYLATNAGLYILNKKDYSLENKTADLQIPFQSISSIFKKDNQFWIFGDKGIYYYDATKKRGRMFTVEDGLPGNEFNVSALAVSANGRCMAGTSNGLVSFMPEKLRNKSYHPRAQFGNMYINDTLYKEIVNLNEVSMVKLAYQQNTFSFDFGTVAFQHNADCTYQYMLKGYDEDWIDAGTTHYTRYSRIPPGRYVFNIRVTDVDGIPSPYGKALSIEISKAYWQTTFFRVLLLAILLLAGGSAIKWYLARKIRKQQIIFRQQHAVEQERTRIAMEMHDDLGSGLTSIRYLAGSLAAQSSSGTRTITDKISDLARGLIDSMNDIVWTMKADNNTAKDVLAYIRKQGAEQLEIANIPFKIDFPVNIRYVRLNSEQKRNLLLISKEAIHNIIKHSGADMVQMTACINSNSLQLTITDNGKGFDPKKMPAFGNGLKNMFRRAEDMNAQLHISHQHGTCIQVTLSFG